MNLIYLKKGKSEPHEQKFIDAFDGRYELRAANFWRGEIETGITAVYTNDERITRKYTKRGYTCYPIAVRKPSKTAPPKAKVTPASKARTQRAKK